MKIKDCIEGEYYFVDFYQHKAHYISKSGGALKCGKYLDLEHKTYNKGSGITWREDVKSTVRPASGSEILWLNKCILNKHYVEKPTILNIYGLGRGA